MVPVFFEKQGRLVAFLSGFEKQHRRSFANGLNPLRRQSLSNHGK